LASLRFWQGIAVIALVSSTGWLVTNAEGAPVWTFVVAVAGVVSLAIGTIIFMLRIKQRIARMGRI